MLGLRHEGLMRGLALVVTLRPRLLNLTDRRQEVFDALGNRELDDILGCHGVTEAVDYLSVGMSGNRDNATANTLGSNVIHQLSPRTMFAGTT
jgi:hypothetical protein